MNSVLKFTIPEGYEIDKEHSTDSEIVYKLKESPFSKSWEEFCNKYAITTKNEAYINLFSEIDTIGSGHTRGSDLDKNLFPIRYGEAFLALMQLLTIREKEYISEGWEPKSEDNTYVIIYNRKIQSIEKEVFNCVNVPLCFPSAELRDKFFENWKDLIEKAKPLL